MVKKHPETVHFFPIKQMIKSMTLFHALIRKKKEPVGGIEHNTQAG
jgi:hypothetical protein